MVPFHPYGATCMCLPPNKPKVGVSGIDLKKTKTKTKNTEAQHQFKEHNITFRSDGHESRRMSSPGFSQETPQKAVSGNSVVCVYEQVAHHVWPKFHRKHLKQGPIIKIHIARAVSASIRSIDEPWIVRLLVRSKDILRPSEIHALGYVCGWIVG